MLSGDEADIAYAFEQAQLESAIAKTRMQATPTETPDEDDQGNRYCLDCGEIIPEMRVKLVQAVRCVDCASLLERGKHRRIGTGGIGRYLQEEKKEDDRGGGYIDYDANTNTKDIPFIG